ncbi:candidate G-protein alpha subunit [Postia placenta Mad-698-R]|nr:candidate G-protein alpha subunit [Postia placenta Mad-698-R]
MANRRRPQVASVTGRRRSISDPLAAALLPPPNETPEQRENRLREEEDAKKRSDRIDKMIKESERERRRKKVIKVLLLGQSESGKSTTLKRECGFDDLDDVYSTEVASIVISSPISSHNRPVSASAAGPDYESYHRRLAPLMELELRLIQLLSDPEDNDTREATHLPPDALAYPPRGFGATPLSSSAFGPSTSAPSRPAPRISIPPTAASSPTSPTSLSPTTELSVSTTSTWKRVLTLGNRSPKSEHTGELQGWWEDPHDPVHILHRCAPVMTELWRDKRVRARLGEKRIRLEESSGFYLDEIQRVTAKMYFPTDEDVLKARLKTNGVVEHSFSLPKNSEFGGVEWKIFDVGGSRPQRRAWEPYFDDVNAIIFLAPISAFDQVLAEDPSVNRLEDSMLLWQSVTSSKLLANVNIVLFLNKCDLLKRKLESGVRLSHHMPSYGDRLNDYETVSNYFRSKFIAQHHLCTPNKSRECFVHLTSVTDSRKTHLIINNVRDIILTGNLKSSQLI